ncbi:unnamed protein product [Owenia fusiformis]|uniref:C-type lectin domain-containing protein n=1 Tax=Owenia fusiformis TaxID=6347 RepID=A0A8S4NPB1_OWEFU|nr:unnamed protein product [Owenia fusiformis]
MLTDAIFWLVTGTLVANTIAGPDCLLFTNWRYQGESRSKFIWKTEKCLQSTVQTLCEQPKDGSGDCPADFPMAIGDSCYWFDLTPVDHDEVSEICALKGGDIAAIDTPSEARELGKLLAAVPDAGYKNYKEFRIKHWTGYKEYANQQEDCKCLILSNYRTKVSDPGKLYITREGCDGLSQLLCEMDIPPSGVCPDGFNDFKVDGSCYMVDFAFNEHDRNDMFCKVANDAGHLVRVDSDFAKIGKELVKLPNFPNGSTVEFTLEDPATGPIPQSCAPPEPDNSNQ